jgi:archaemetzincin
MTMRDLYYNKSFYGLESADRGQPLLRRSCKVLAHETSHMLGIQHWIDFNCLMNGSNHLDQSDRRPIDLCPMDLRKLSIGFDISERYQTLLDFAGAVHFDDKARNGRASAWAA